MANDLYIKFFRKNMLVYKNNIFFQNVKLALFM